MGKELKVAFLSFSGASIALGVLGFLSGLIGLFFTNIENIPFVVFIFTCWIFLSVLIVLAKMIYELSKRPINAKPFETPISFNESIECFLIKSNPHFTGQILVGCYSKIDGYEQLAYIGNIHHVQDTALQIKIIKDMEVLPSIPITQSELKKIEVRPVIPMAAISEIRGSG